MIYKSDHPILGLFLLTLAPRLIISCTSINKHRMQPITKIMPRSTQAQLKSPIKQKPLRHPGQSLNEYIANRIDDAMVWVICTIFLILYALQHWWAFFYPFSPKPWLTTFMALAAVTATFFKIRADKQSIKNYRQGESGEIAVGQYLDRMRSDGAHILHDIPGNDFNLDHVIMSPKGLFVIETKTWSKQDGGKEVVSFDGDSLSINGSIVSNAPIIQCSAGANFLAELLEESTGTKFAVQSILALPGWYVENTAGFSPGTVWVLSAKAIPKFISKLPDSLRDDEVSMANFHLSQYVRANS